MDLLCKCGKARRRMNNECATILGNHFPKCLMSGDDETRTSDLCRDRRQFNGWRQRHEQLTCSIFGSRRPCWARSARPCSRVCSTISLFVALSAGTQDPPTKETNFELLDGVPLIPAAVNRYKAKLLVDTVYFAP